MVLLLGDSKNPLLQAVHAALLGRVKLLALNHSNLVNDLQVDDDICRDGRANIRWFIENRQIAMHEITGALNELYYLPESALSSYHPDDREYAAAEHTAYLVFALHNFRNVINPPSFGTLSGFSRSLPFQWMTLTRTHPNIEVPKFHFGAYQFLPEILKESHNCIISHDIYNTKHWQTESTFRDRSGMSPALFYLRPSGAPVFVVTAKSRFWYATQSQNFLQQSGLDSGIKDAIESMCQQLSLDLATVLLFHDDRTNKWTFGSISASIDVNVCSKEVLDEVISHIVSLLTTPA